MKKSYLLVYNDNFGDRDEVKQFLEIPEVTHWRYDLPNCFYVVSESNAYDLAQKLREANPKNGRFIISEITSNKHGWLTPESWHLINKKRYKPKED